MSILDSHASIAPLYSEQVVRAKRFLVDPRRAHRDGLTVGGGLERVRSDYVVVRSHFSFAAIELVVGGRGSVTLDGREYPLEAGTCFTYAGRLPHRLSTSPKQPLTKYFLDLNAVPGRRLVRAAGLPVGTAWVVRDWPDAARLLDEIIHHGSGNGPQRQRLCDALVRALLLHLGQSVSQPRPQSQAYCSYERCLSLIETRAHRLRSLADLAVATELDAAYICRLFKRFDDRSPYQRLLSRRMTTAAIRLYGGNAVQTVAREMGFTDPFSFSRTFKAVLGASPSTFSRKPRGSRTDAG